MKKKAGMNKKVLTKMTESAMPQPPKVMMHLRGKQAEQFLGKKPGSRVSAHIRGTVQTVGLSEWNHDEPTADIKITNISPMGKEK